MTYTFTSIAGGTAKFKSSGGYHIPSTKPEMYENPDSVIFRADTTQYVIYPAIDTIIVNGTTNAPGSLSVTQLSDALNVLFPKATTTGGGNGSATTDASQLISGTLPDARLSGNVSLALKPTAIKTTAYTAAAGELVKVDATAANVPITLPTAPVDKTRIAVKMIGVSGSNVATITTGGTDVFNKSGGSTSATLTLLNQAVTLQYEAAIGVWSVISSDMPLSQLDARFSKADVANDLRPEYRTVAEYKVRKPNANWQYTGTVRMVGAGQTYATIGAAITAAVSGDIIQLIDGTYLASAEAGGYLSFNDSSKRLLIRGNATNNAAVTFQSTANTFCLLVQSCNELTLQNITITSNQSRETVYINCSFTNKIAFDNCIIANTGTGGRTVSINNTPAFANYYEFKNCDISSTNTTTLASTIGFSANSSITDANYTSYPQAVLITGGVIRNYQNWQDISINFTMYDVQCIQSLWASSYVFAFGSDVNQPVTSLSKVDIRGCSFKYLYGYFGHSVLLGRGTKNVYFVNNDLFVPPSTNTLALGLVIKSISSNVGDIIIEGNNITAPRPLYIKGAQKCRIRYNTAVSNYPDLTNGFGLEINNPNNPDGPIASTGNVITWNTLTGKIAAIGLNTAPTAPTAASSAQASTIDYNRYKVSAATGYINNDGTLITWTNKSAFWSNDVNSTFTTP